jgi:DNA-directed RNA polymerase specialized sigma54-like protein
MGTELEKKKRKLEILQLEAAQLEQEIKAEVVGNQLLMGWTSVAKTTRQKKLAMSLLQHCNEYTRPGTIKVIRELLNVTNYQGISGWHHTLNVLRVLDNSEVFSDDQECTRGSIKRTLNKVLDYAESLEAHPNAVKFFDVGHLLRIRYDNPLGKFIEW